MWNQELVICVQELREENPSWGKEKLKVLLGRRGWTISSSTVGRILVDLKLRSVLHEPPRELVKYKSDVKSGNLPFENPMIT